MEGTLKPRYLCSVNSKSEGKDDSLVFSPRDMHQKPDMLFLMLRGFN